MKPQAGLALGGRYRLIRQIAVGGMGEVWVAKDESLARDIAVKVLKEEFVGNADFLNRFRVEARNAASLSHAHIAQLYDYGEQDGSAYLVMELVHGEPMSDLLEREPVLPLGRLLTILSQTARALHAAHVGGVVHRDIKPGNIIIEHSGDVKITDFGVSLAANQVPMTAAGMVMGTAQYLSPEQAIGRPATGASDIYALGIVAYEAIAGNRPFTGKTPVDIAVAHVNEPVPPLPRTTHVELATLIMRMLSKDPLERPRSGAALAHTFEALAQEIAANPWKSTARTSAASPVSHGLAPSRDKAVEDLGPQLRSAPSASSAAPQTTWQPSGSAVGGRAAANPVPKARAHDAPAAVRPRPYHTEPGLASPAPAHQESRAAAAPTYRADTTRRAVHSGGGTSRATTQPAHGKAGDRPDRRQEVQRTTAKPQSFLERIKSLGVVGMTMLGVIALIILATAIKGMISAVGSHTPTGTVAEKFSSVEFTFGAPHGIEVREIRGIGVHPTLTAQAIKDA